MFKNSGSAFAKRDKRQTMIDLRAIPIIGLQKIFSSHETVPLMTTFPFILFLGYLIHSALWFEKTNGLEKPAGSPETRSRH
jgi:hypothetical protein